MTQDSSQKQQQTQSYEQGQNLVNFYQQSYQIELLKKVLMWDYFEIIKDSDQGKGPTKDLIVLPQKFKSYQEYVQQFSNMILEESASELLRGGDDSELQQPFPGAISSCDKEDEFDIIRLTFKQGTSSKFKDMDILLLSRDNPQGDKVSQQHHTLGYMEGHEGEQSARIRLYMPQDVSHEQLQRVKNFRKYVSTGNNVLYALKLTSMVTIFREWNALHSVVRLEYIDALVKADASFYQENIKLKIPAKLQQTLEQMYNKSQVSALTAGQSGRPFILIQGPPGTGKTRTILGLLSILITQAQRSNAQDQENKNSLNNQNKGNSIADEENINKEVHQELHVTKKQKFDKYSSFNGDNGTFDNSMGDRQRLIGESIQGENNQKEEVGMELSTKQGQTRDLWRLSSPWMFGDTCELDKVPPYTTQPSNEMFGLSQAVSVKKIQKQKQAQAHILVCAPSNSALDEIVLRICQNGLLNQRGAHFSPIITRVGVNVHHSVKQFSIESLTESNIELAQSKQGKSLSSLEKDRIRTSILDDSNIVCSTLAFTGSSMFRKLTKKFDYIVIDEAAQAVEPSTLIALCNGARQIYLVGDPQQLPATVISKRAIQNKYDRSLFNRLQTAGYPVNVLEVQYRMNPQISKFPSRQFYLNKLTDDKSVGEVTAKDWHKENNTFGPYVFYNVNGKEENPDNSNSIINRQEADFIVELFKQLLRRFPSVLKEASIAVVSPYKAQVKFVQRKLQEVLGDSIEKYVDVNTIDGYQGREKDIVIFSCVRGGQKRKGNSAKIGFVADERRLNVGLTRARTSQIIVGNIRDLGKDLLWGSLILDAKCRNLLYDVKTPYIDCIKNIISGKLQPQKATINDLQNYNQHYLQPSAEDENQDLEDDMIIDH